MPLSQNILQLSLEQLDIAEKKKKPVLVVGISGCTSSGKSLLALLLAKVFDHCKFNVILMLFFTFVFISIALHSTKGMFQINEPGPSVLAARTIDFG